MDISKKIKFGVRIAAILLIIFFFVPTVSVSCSGYTTEISALNAVTGNYGGANTDASLGGLLGTTSTSMSQGIVSSSAYLLLLLPVLAILILVFSNSNAIISSVCAAGSAIGMLLFKSGVKKEVKLMMGEMGEDAIYGEELFSVKGTIWFTIHIIVCIAIIAVLMYEKFVLQNPENKKKIAGAVGGVFGNITNPVQTPRTDSRTCAKCGTALADGAKFCATCGTPVPPPAPKKVEKFCSTCGTKYVEGTAFCSACGNKLN